MEVGKDDLCPRCKKWQPFDDNGNCSICGTFINVGLKHYSWFEKFGVELKELENESADF